MTLRELVQEAGGINSPAMENEIQIYLNDSYSSTEMPIQGEIIIDDKIIYIAIGREFHK